MQLRVSPPSRHGLKARALALCMAGLACGLPAAGCRPEPRGSAEVGLDWTLAPSPPAVGPAMVSLALTDKAAGQPVTGAAVRLEADMAHPGMEPAFSSAAEVAPGRYRAPVQLGMPGDWILLVEAVLRDGRTMQWQVDLRGVRPR